MRRLCAGYLLNASNAPTTSITTTAAIWQPIGVISNAWCYEPSVTRVSVTKAGLAGTDRRDGRDRTMGRGLSESRGSV